MIRTFEQFINEHNNIKNSYDKNMLISQCEKLSIVEKIIDDINDDKSLINDELYKFLKDEICGSFESKRIEVLIDDEYDIKNILGLSSFGFNNSECEIYTIAVYYELTCDFNDEVGRDGKSSAYYRFESFEIDTDCGTLTNEDFGITEKTHKDLFKIIDLDLSDYWN
jgi:hypothetical protein